MINAVQDIILKIGKDAGRITTASSFCVILVNREVFPLVLLFTERQTLFYILFVSEIKLIHHFITVHPMLVPQEIDSWAVIMPNHQKHDVKQFISTLRSAGYSMELRLSEPTYVEVHDIRNASYVEAVEQAMLYRQLRFILVVLPHNRLDLYR